MKNFAVNLLFLATFILQTGCAFDPITSQGGRLTNTVPVPTENRNVSTSHHPERKDIVALLSPRERVLEVARGMLGVPYQWGGNTPRGFDCSGLVYYAHKKAGVLVPRTAAALLNKSSPIDFEALGPGDLVFFRLSANKISHVGIYAGNGKFLHAPSTGKGVSYARFDNPNWRDRFIRGGRFIFK